MDHLTELLTALKKATAHYDDLKVMKRDGPIDWEVGLDLNTRLALKAMIRAEDEYNAALDEEATRRFSESTAIGLAAE